MDFSVYAQPRRFALPRLGKSDAVGGDAVLWALLSGPFFFWKKGAMMEAVVIGFLTLPTLPLWVVDSESYHLEELGGLVWLGAGFLAPLLLAGSYVRRGWVDVTARPLALEDAEGVLDDRAEALAEEDGLRLPPRRGRLLDLAEDDVDAPDEPPAAPAGEQSPRLRPRPGRLLDLTEDDVAEATPDEHQGLTLPPRRGRRFLDMTESDLD
jgi:hypothetical protein